MIERRNFSIPGKHGKPVVADFCCASTGEAKPLVFFIHGYKGFKDWGVFGCMDELLLAAGFAVFKMNFSHNGGTVDEPIDFPDLEAFGNNNYSIELDDVASALEWIRNEQALSGEVDLNCISLIGHSRGGAIAILTAAQDARIHRLVTWASVSTLHRTMFNEGAELDEWKRNGVLYVKNGRTGQDMPHYIQFYEDYLAHRERLDVEAAARKLSVPHLILHGKGDSSVPHTHAMELHAWSSLSRLHLIADADHVFGGKHPWTGESLPADFEEVLTETVGFLLEG
ncbi:MAG: alpha/beta hydrolase family protein [Flavobacteriales bacterium]